jgi:dTDP-4-amino-4,6-dideoxygalactose transaminase
VRPGLDDLWSELLATSGFIGGRTVDQFEEEWARFCGTRYAVGTANGTDAIELLLRALGVGQGDEVIVPANTFIATAEAVVMAGATPRFADVDPTTLQINVENVREAITKRTAAVIAVDLYGSMPDMQALASLCDQRGLLLLEDAAQAHGALLEGRRAGSWGRAGSFSFYPGKNLGAFGDAGSIVTDDDDLAERVRSLANHGRLPGAPHAHTELARNSRLDALQAGVLSLKLARLDEWNASRRVIDRAYRARLLGCADLQLLKIPSACEAVHHQFVIQVRDRDFVRQVLAGRGIETGIHYPIPCHLNPPYSRFADHPLPVAEDAAARILSLPLFPHMTVNQVDAVTTELLATLEDAHGRSN